MKKIASVFITVTVALMMMTPGFAWADTAANDISAANVTKLSISRTDGTAITDGTIETGSDMMVRLEFSDLNGTKRIKGGDVIKVSWPTTGDAYFQGYSNTIPLKITYNGKEYNVGEAVITTSGATITFNDTVNEMYDVQGWAEFQIQGWNAADTDAESTRTAAITAGAETQSVNIHKAARGTAGEAQFYYKNGAIYTSDTDHVQWFLNVNGGYKTVDGDVVIKDEIQGGQKLDPATFHIGFVKDGAWTSESYDGTTGITSFLKIYPKSSITCDADSGTINVTLDKSAVDGRGVVVSYKTEITDKTQASFSNNTTASYHVTDNDAVTDQVENASVKNISSGAGVTGLKKGEMKIQKVIDGTDTPIAGVKFELSRTDGADVTEGNAAVELTTDSNGEADIKDLAAGEYSIKETSAPSWIDFDASTARPITFTVSDTDTEGHLEKISNKKKTVDVTAEKVWKTADTTMPDTWFKLYRSVNGGAAAAVEGAEIIKLTDGTVTATWKDMDTADNSGNAYTYSVREVNADGEDYVPSGYSKTEEGLTVTNTQQSSPSTPKASGGSTTNTSENHSGSNSGNTSTTAVKDKAPKAENTAPKTGDQSNIVMYSVIMLLAALGCAAAVRAGRKHGSR